MKWDLRRTREVYMHEALHFSLCGNVCTYVCEHLFGTVQTLKGVYTLHLREGEGERSISISSSWMNTFQLWGFFSSHFLPYNRINLYEVCNWLTCNIQRFFSANFIPGESTVWVLNCTIKERRITHSGVQSLAGLLRKTHWSATSKNIEPIWALWGCETVPDFNFLSHPEALLLPERSFFLIILHWQKVSMRSSGLMVAGL